MGRFFLIGYLIFSTTLSSCSGTKNTYFYSDISKELEERNKGNISLLQRIQQLPGVMLRNGVPHFIKSFNQVSGGTPSEPLYILNGYVVGNSFNSLNQLVESFNVKKIEAITGPGAAEYGVRGGSGVIKITTYQ
ncbi:Plug domain-containing protein [Muricauda sp. CAU 1633]|uniref:TonB-dependent receptor plug domain-containing protein n=1 Tax=Allomuricauda sp. CAU 1633 TaxID=2816036 RepID=UPI001A8D4EFC|nr:Plug domain-containing protein [Muricauda sp. CAU 1633]MBO0320754.1 Plug domain-containing protein [Muricauda sp. CAU 1633]